MHTLIVTSRAHICQELFANWSLCLFSLLQPVDSSAYLLLILTLVQFCMVDPVPAWLQANLFKTERDKVSRALAKEVGDETPLSKVVEAGSEWRGWAQQISLLKAKVSELQQAQVLLLVLQPCNASICSAV